MTHDSLGAVLLAGGRATRVDGAEKHLFDVGGMTLLDRAISAASSAGASPIVVVGDRPEARPAETSGGGTIASGRAAASESDMLRPDVTWIREDPAFGGPAAATMAALHAWAVNGSSPEWMLLLACDLPRADAVVARLRADIVLLPSDTDGVCLADESGRPQWLSGLYRTEAVRQAASALPDRGRNAPARTLFHDLAIAVIAVASDIVTDIDTWDDLARARAAAKETS